MNCAEAREYLGAYLDGELDLLTSLRIEQHVAGCVACREEQESNSRLHVLLQEPEVSYKAPAGLERRIAQALDRASAPDTRRLSSLVWVRYAAILVAVLVGVGLIYRLTLRQSGAQLIARDVVSSHIRSLMENHLSDVISTDEHTVKPWFRGKLDFSPPVVNLAPEGFPLVGGRLDYVDGRNVSALVYQRRKHIINVYLWPAPDTSTGNMHEENSKGYAIFNWNEGGMTYWVISDLNRIELSQFVQRLRSH